MYQSPSIPAERLAALKAAAKPTANIADKLLRFARIEAERVAAHALELSAFLPR